MQTVVNCVACGRSLFAQNVKSCKCINCPLIRFHVSLVCLAERASRHCEHSCERGLVRSAGFQLKVQTAESSRDAGAKSALPSVLSVSLFRPFVRSGYTQRPIPVFLGALEAALQEQAHREDPGSSTKVTEGPCASDGSSPGAPPWVILMRCLCLSNHWGG